MGDESKTFEQALEDYRKKLNHIQLPDLNMAMHTSQVYFTDDISDKNNFNDRYIESHVNEGMSAFAIYLMMGMHNFLLPSLIYILFFYDGVTTDPIMYFGTVVMYLTILAPLYFTAKNFHPTPVRFNRQSQCMHIFWDKKSAITIPWKTALPFSVVGQTSSGRHSVVFLCPVPSNANFLGHEYLHSLEVPAAFDSGDFTMSGNFNRLEFIRRYMEKGLDVIQPKHDLVKKGLVSKPSGHAPDLTYKTHGFGAIIINALAKPGYFIATGWLVDKWVQKRANSYVWPEDVQKLCAEGADISALDTKVVTPRDDLFYGYIKGEFTYLDRNGNEVH